MEMETLPRKIAEARSRLQEIEKQLSAVNTDKGDRSFISEVKSAALESEKTRTLAGVDLFEKQLSAGQTLISLYTHELELAMRRVTQNNVFLKVWRKRVQDLRQSAASEAIRDAEKAKRKTPEQMPVIKAQYDVNIQMSPPPRRSTSGGRQAAAASGRNGKGIAESDG